MATPNREITLLGVFDGDLDDSKHRSSFLTNKVGGLPDLVPGFPPSSPRCGCCSVPLVHVVQVYCPLMGSPYHRTLQLFACPAAECSGRAKSWTALRYQSLEVEGVGGRSSAKTEPAKEAPMSASDWCDSADDWGINEEFEELVEIVPEKEKVVDVPEEMSNQLDSLHIAEPQPDVPILHPFFISVVDERDVLVEDDVGLSHAEKLLKDYERREGVVAGLDESSGEKYEKTQAHHGDHSFSRFRKRISACPQQILRYCRGGQTLFISEPPTDERQLVPPCTSCGGPRTFEFQLMPALVSLLSWKDAVGTNAASLMEFGTVLVYTCAVSCWTSSERNPRSEFCFVQMDPDQELFK
ncbi:programmed cell death protein 2-like isoform X1 [Stigmatopora nigra]